MPFPVFQALAPHLPPRALASGEVLFQEGQPGDAMALLSSGRLRLEVAVPGGPPQALGDLEPGEVVGEMTCLDPAPRSATVRAVEASQVRLLDRGTLAVLRDRSPGTWVAVLRAVVARLGERVREADRRVEEMTFSLRLAGDEVPGDAPWAGGGPDPARPQRLGILPAGDLAALGEAARSRRLEDGQFLCREGDEATSCFLVRSGTLEVLRQAGDVDLCLATLAPGSIAGTVALLDEGWRTASLRARGPAEVLELDRVTFDRLLEARVPLALRFQEQLAVAGIRQLRMADRWLARLAGTEAARAASGFTPRTPAPLHVPARAQAWEADPLAIPLSAAPPPPAAPRTDAEASTHVKSYMRTALREWGMSLEELDAVHVVVPEGQVTASEIRARRRWFT